MALEPLIGTADVTNGSDVVTVHGVVLSPLNCVAPAQVLLAGVGYSVKDRINTTSFHISRPYEGVDATGISLEIAPWTPEMSSRVTLSQNLLDYQARLALISARGFGQLYTAIGVTGVGDPGPGNIARDQSAWADTTQIYIDVLDASSSHIDQTALLANFKQGGWLKVESIETGAYALYELTEDSIAASGYRKLLNLSYLAGDGPGDGEDVRLVYMPPGADGAGLAYDDSGSYAARTAHDAEAKNYAYLSLDGDGGTITSAVVFVKLSATSGDWSAAIPVEGPEGKSAYQVAVVNGFVGSQSAWLASLKGDQGETGWSPVDAFEADGDRVVRKLTGYTGGTGTAPTANVGKYYGASGMVTLIADGFDCRGLQGISAYDVAVENGFVGTEAEWLTSLEGTDPGILLNFDTGTTDADPGAGKLRADNAALNSATFLYISKTNRAGSSITTRLLDLASSTNNTNRGALILTQQGTEKQTSFRIVGVTDATGYVKVGVADHAGETAIANNVPFSLQTEKVGNKGADGAGAVDSVNGYAGIVVLATDDISDTSQVHKWATAAEKTKLGYLSVTAATDLDAIRTKAGNLTVTAATDLDAIRTRVNQLDAAVVLKGGWDASSGSFPGSGAAQAGESYIVTVAGTVDGVSFNVNDRAIAILDNASTTTFASNWFKADYTDQVLSVAGKTGVVTIAFTDLTDTLIFSQIAPAAIASDSEARAGTAANKLMTPQRTAAAIETLSGLNGQDVVFTADASITAAHKGKTLAFNKATAVAGTLASPATLGSTFLALITNIGVGDLTVNGTFDDGSTSVVLQTGESMAVGSNGTVHRLLLRGGGSGGGGLVIPIFEEHVGDGSNKITCTATPPSAGTFPFVGGAIQPPGSFTIAGNDILFGSTITTGVPVNVIMLKGSATELAVVPLSAEFDGTGGVGPYTIPATPQSDACLFGFVGGIKMSQVNGVDYTYAGNQVTLSEDPAGDKVEFWVVQQLSIGVPGDHTVGNLQLKTEVVGKMIAMAMIFGG